MKHEWAFLVAGICQALLALLAVAEMAHLPLHTTHPLLALSIPIILVIVSLVLCAYYFKEKGVQAERFRDVNDMFIQRQMKIKAERQHKGELG